MRCRELCLSVQTFQPLIVINSYPYLDLMMAQKEIMRSKELCFSVQTFQPLIVIINYPYLDLMMAPEVITKCKELCLSLLISWMVSILEEILRSLFAIIG